MYAGGHVTWPTSVKDSTQATLRLSRKTVGVASDVRRRSPQYCCWTAAIPYDRRQRNGSVRNTDVENTPSPSPACRQSLSIRRSAAAAAEAPTVSDNRVASHSDQVLSRCLGGATRVNSRKSALNASVVKNRLQQRNTIDGAKRRWAVTRPPGHPALLRGYVRNQSSNRRGKCVQPSGLWPLATRAWRCHRLLAAAGSSLGSLFSMPNSELIDSDCIHLCIELILTGLLHNACHVLDWHA